MPEDRLQNARETIDSELNVVVDNLLQHCMTCRSCCKLVRPAYLRATRRSPQASTNRHCPSASG